MALCIAHSNAELGRGLSDSAKVAFRLGPVVRHPPAEWRRRLVPDIRRSPAGNVLRARQRSP